MKKCASDLPLIIGLFLAHLLLFFTFEDKSVFWYIFTASMLILISYSIIKEDIDDQASIINYLTYGILSGLVLFGVFWVGNIVIRALQLPFKDDISALYSRLTPSELWHYIVLILIIIPGEEIFWRGFVQKRLSKYFSAPVSVVTASLLYASVQFYSGFILLPLAAFVSGLFWGSLYSWKKSLPLVIVSHLIFDLFLLVLMPLG